MAKTISEAANKANVRQPRQRRSERSCECVNQINEQLVSQGLRLKLYNGFTFDFEKHTGSSFRSFELETERIGDKKPKSKPKIFASYCPICGQKIPESGLRIKPTA